MARAVLGREISLDLAAELLPYLRAYQRTATDLQELDLATGDITDPGEQEFIEDVRLSP